MSAPASTGVAQHWDVAATAPRFIGRLQPRRARTTRAGRAASVAGRPPTAMSSPRRSEATTRRRRRAGLGRLARRRPRTSSHGGSSWAPAPATGARSTTTSARGIAAAMERTRRHLPCAWADVTLVRLVGRRASHNLHRVLALHHRTTGDRRMGRLDAPVGSDVTTPTAPAGRGRGRWASNALRRRHHLRLECGELRLELGLVGGSFELDDLRLERGDLASAAPRTRAAARVARARPEVGRTDTIASDRNPAPSRCTSPRRRGCAAGTPRRRRCRT